MELNEYGKKVWKHRRHQSLFLEKSYRWVDRLLLVDETRGRKIVDSFVASTFDYSEWLPMNKEEYSSVNSKYIEMYQM